MRVGSFATIVFLKMFVDEAAILVQQFDGNASLRSCRRNLETCLHVLDNLESGAANRRGFDLFSGSRSSWFCFSSWRGGWLSLRRRLCCSSLRVSCGGGTAA